MGYVVTIQDEYNPSQERKYCFVLNSKGSWNGRLNSSLLDPVGFPGIRIFGAKEEADKEAARVLAGDRVHGPDPRGTVLVMEVDNKPCSACDSVDGVFRNGAHEDPSVCISTLKARLKASEAHESVQI